MATLLIILFTGVLILVCAIVIILILMQRASANAGMGAALGGGAAESAFGGETANVLSRGTIYMTAAFFVLAFALYLANMALSERPDLDVPALPELTAPAGVSDVPATTGTTTSGESTPAE